MFSRPKKKRVEIHMKKYPRRSISKHQRLTLREEILSKTTSVKEPFLLMLQARRIVGEKLVFINPERGVFSLCHREVSFNDAPILGEFGNLKEKSVRQQKNRHLGHLTREELKCEIKLLRI